MKNFKDYLTESQRAYNYRIKVVGDVAPDFWKALDEKLKQFDVINSTSVKSTPVQLKIGRAHV